uniref:Uncharacterized protein n=1 Tax=viral metagenome TaxID=1070528 RepID=A0A6C0CCN7_9ZZZZ
MKTEKIEGIVSLLKTENIVIINALFESGFMTIDMLKTAMSEYMDQRNKYVRICFIVALVDLFDVIEDKEFLDDLISLFSGWNCGTIIWDESVMQSFIKLVNLDGKMPMYCLVGLPYDAFLYYIEKNEFSATFESTGDYGNQDPKVKDFINEKLQTDIESFSLEHLLTYSLLCIINKENMTICMGEIYNRSAIDRLMIRVAYSTRSTTLVDEHMAQCQYQNEFLFLCSLLSINDGNKTLNDESLSLKRFLESNEEAFSIAKMIKSYRWAGTGEDLQFVIPKLNRLMEMYG